MKKCISLVLALVLALSLVVPCFAEVTASVLSPIPIVGLAGDGEALYDEDGNVIFYFSDLASGLTGSGDTQNLISSVLNVLRPLLVQGFLMNDYTAYYEAFGKEVGELFEKARCDGNGDPTPGTGVSAYRRQQMEKELSSDAKTKRGGKYYYEDYWFWYDWRLDPMYTADLLHDFIGKVKEVTGSSEVCLMSRCLGSSVLLAYIEKYGLEGIHGVTFHTPVSYGCELMSEPISGKFKLDGSAVRRFLADLEALKMIDLDDFIDSTVELLVRSSAFDGTVEFVREELYSKVMEGLISSLATSTFFTWPIYWSAVSNDDYDEAMRYVFGPEGSEKRAEYAGLIEKIENYRNRVGSKTLDIVKRIKDEGKNLSIVSKYGFQMIPVCESMNKVGDQYISIERSTFGATASDIYGVLSDEYIAQRVAEGKEKYISPDKQIDASTCLFPDYTFFIKDLSHTTWSEYEQAIGATVASADRQLIAGEDLPRFYVAEVTNGNVLVPMTTANCNTYHWTAIEEVDHPKTEEQLIYSAVTSIIKWVASLLKLLAQKTDIFSNLGFISADNVVDFSNIVQKVVGLLGEKIPVIL